MQVLSGSFFMPSAVRSFCSLVAHSFLLASLVFISKEQSFSQVPLGQERRLLAEIHIEQKARAFQLSVSNPQCQLVLMLQCEIWRRKAAWDIKNYRQNSSGKATSLLVALTRAGALPSWRRGVLRPALQVFAAVVWGGERRANWWMLSSAICSGARRKGKKVTDAGLKQHFRFFLSASSAWKNR